MNIYSSRHEDHFGMMKMKYSGRTILDISRDEMWDMFVDNELLSREIADILGCTAIDVVDFRITFGIGIRHRSVSQYLVSAETTTVDKNYQCGYIAGYGAAIKELDLRPAMPRRTPVSACRSGLTLLN